MGLIGWRFICIVLFLLVVMFKKRDAEKGKGVCLKNHYEMFWQMREFCGENVTGVAQCSTELPYGRESQRERLIRKPVKSFC